MGIAARWGRSPAAPRTRTRRSSWSWMDNRARRSATKRSQETLPCFLLPTMIFLEQRRKRRKMGNSGEIRRRLFWLVLRRGGRRRIFRVNTDVVGIRAGRFQPRGGRNTRRSLSWASTGQLPVSLRRQTGGGSCAVTSEKPLGSHAHGFLIDSLVNRAARPVRSSRDLELEEPKTAVNGA
jgi:hypothetical protein